MPVLTEPLHIHITSVCCVISLKIQIELAIETGVYDSPIGEVNLIPVPCFLMLHIVALINHKDLHP